MTYAEILTRLEAAAGPDREIDAMIAEMVDPEHTRLIWANSLPTYTASLDAVVGLVESQLLGWGRMVECSPEDGARAKVWLPEAFFYPGSEPVTFVEFAKTEPLALLTAAIRALADK